MNESFVIGHNNYHFFVNRFCLYVAALIIRSIGRHKVIIFKKLLILTILTLIDVFSKIG